MRCFTRVKSVLAVPLLVTGCLSLLGCGDQETTDQDSSETIEGTDSTVVSSDDTSDNGPTSCDPLTAEYVPITITKIIAVGQDAAGVIYIVGEWDAVSGPVAFVSDGDILYRKEVPGFGEGGDMYMLTIKTDDGGESTILVEIDSSDTISMAVVHGEEYEGFIADMGENGELLTVLDERAVSHMTVQNLTYYNRVEYYATVENGATLLVTVPEHDWDNDDQIHLYYGQGTALTEYPIVSFARANDGGSTKIRFTLDDQEAFVSFPVTLVDEADGLERGSATLTLGSDTLAVTWNESSEFNVDNYSITCITQ